MNVNCKLDLFLSELIGLGRNELVLKLRHGLPSAPWRRDGALLGFGVGCHRDERAYVVHDSLLGRPTDRLPFSDRLGKFIS